MKLKWKDDGTFKTPLARARGLGASHDGAAHWWHQRITALASLPLTIWLVWSVVHMQGWTYTAFTAWQAAPVNAVLMILSVISIFYHAALGTQVIVEDYVHVTWMKMVKVIGLQFFFVAAGIACIFSILKISFVG